MVLRLMIVKCDKCQTRFKIPDEKVTEKGVKVRCTKCQNTFKVTKANDAGAAAPAAASSPPPPPPPAVDPDPFSRFGVGQGPGLHEATRPGLFPEGIAATREPLAPSFSAQQDVPQEVFDSPTRVAPIPKGLLDLAPPPPPAEAAPPASGFDPSNPFRPQSDFEMTSPRMPTFEPPPEAFAPPPPPASAVDTLAASTQAAAASSAPAMSDPFFAAMENDQPATQTSTGLLGNLPGPDEGLFADPGSPLTSGPMSGENLAFTAAGPDRALFDMPAPPPAPPAADDEPTAQSSATVSIPLARVSLAQAPSMEKPAGRPEDVGMAEARGGASLRRTFGLVANLVVASLLVVVLVSVGTIYLNEGKLDVSALSLEPVKALFASPGDLFAVDVSNGLYDTRGGRPVFYVRGEVENRGDKPSRVKVNVEILDGPTALTTAAALAGASPSPEELHGVTSTKELAALAARLDQAAVEVKPGQRAPFLVAFFEYPPDLAQYRLKVTVQEASPETAAR